MKGVYYRGKKFPFVYNNDITGKCEFGTRDVVWLSDAAANFLTSTSPSDFVLADIEPEVQAEAPVEEPVKEPTEKPYTCKKCGHISYGRSDAMKHWHQCKGLANGDSLDGTDTA